jgi:hypothetical protein
MQGGAFQGGRAAVEDKDGLDAIPKELANAAEEANNMAVAQSIALLVANGLEELVDPDGSINGETLVVEGGEVRGTSAGLHDGPEALNTHDEPRRKCISGI